MNASSLFDHLTRLAERDSGAIAALKRSVAFAPGTYVRAFPSIEPLAAGAWPRERRLAYLLAGLWAVYGRRSHGKPQPMAEAFRRIHRADKSPSTQLRFTALLDADEDELEWRLRHAIALISAHDIALDWAGLMDDLRRWEHPDRYIQQQWARTFFASPDIEQNADDKET